MNDKRLIFIFFLILLIPTHSFAIKSDENLISNDLAKWIPFSWKDNRKILVDKIISASDDGSFRISSTKKNDVGLKFRKSIKKGKYYRFGALVNTENVTGNIGANLSIHGSNLHSRKSLTGKNNWKPLELVFRATENTEVDFSLRLGFTNNTASGDAWFDNITLYELNDWNHSYQILTYDRFDKKQISKPIRILSFFIITPFLILSLHLLLNNKINTNATLPQEKASQDIFHSYFFLISLAIALLLRLAFTLTITQNPESVSTTETALLLSGASSDPLTSNDNHATIYTIWLFACGLFVKFLNLEGSSIFPLLTRFPIFAFEIFITIFAIRKLHQFFSLAATKILILLILFNPVSIFLFSFVEYDIIVTAGIFSLAVISLSHKKVTLSALFFGISIASNFLLLIPYLVATYYIYQEKQHRNTFKFIILATFSSLISILIINSLTSEIQFINSQYFSKFFAQNFISNLLIISIILLFSLFLLHKKRSVFVNAEGRGKNIIFLFGTVSLSIAAIPQHQDFVYLAFTCYLFSINKSRNSYWMPFITSLLSLYIFTSQQYYQQLNISSPEIYGATSLIYILIIFTWFFTVRKYELITYSFSKLKTISKELFLNSSQIDEKKWYENTNIKWYDIIVVIFFCFTSFILITWNIGEKNYPVTSYSITNEKQIFEFWLDSPKIIQHTRVYIGESGNGKIKFEFYKKGKWLPLWKKNNGELKIEKRATFTHSWHSVKLKIKIDRIRVLSSGEKLDINEIVFFDSNNKIITPVALRQTGLAFKEAVTHPFFDEQNKITQTKNYLTKTYWDEIFYTRSAYNLLHQMEPFEKSHPPFGKLLIGLGIKTYGMTPYGWRITNAVFISLFPILLFFGGLWITKNKLGAYLASFLIVIELIPFIHGRWSNIDTFLVFFLTLSLLLLFKWHKNTNGNFKFDRKTLLFCFASIFFGLAISIKWSALFTGFSIFVLFLLAMYYQNFIYQKPVPGIFFAQIKQNVHPIFFWAIGFLVTPVTIYYFSHFQFIQSISPGTSLFSHDGLHIFLEQQKFIWNHHSEGQDVHKSASMFYTWPFNIQLVRMFTTGGLSENQLAIIQIMGNPVIYWIGMICIGILLWKGFSGGNQTAAILSIVFFVQAMPWILVTRTTFIYHFFPFVPILILAIAFVVTNYLNRKSLKYTIPLICLGGAIGFAANYPFVTGMIVDEGYFNLIKSLKLM